MAVIVPVAAAIYVVAFKLTIDAELLVGFIQKATELVERVPGTLTKSSTPSNLPDLPYLPL